ncbi:MAG: Flp pilus assembly complex ATPase component TadA, partial [Gammaproteobacteria bacterium]|nr:Flp pilus assembly complex ATPase component TadA [Gammaproteobacteria bacterium]
MDIKELLIAKKLITEEQLTAALAKQEEVYAPLGKILINTGLIKELQYLALVAEAEGVEFVDLDNYEIDPALASRLTASEAQLLHAILLEETADACIVGMSDPKDIFAIDALTNSLEKEIKPVLVSETTLRHVLETVYKHPDQLTGFAKELDTELKPKKNKKPEIDAETDSAVLKLINSLFEDAVYVGASDIHIEPDENMVRIRFRVDGFLQEQVLESKNIAPALSQRLKLMASLNIAEKRLPQDGRFNISIQNQSIDVRMSTMPIEHGESIVMRLLTQSTGMLNLDSAGMPDAMLAQFRGLIKRPRGIILVTGPTGSGKTTTLYAALNEMNDSKKKLITIEDPVEYRLPRINQIQVNSSLDLTFARVLRSVLRQDPDI